MYMKRVQCTCILNFILNHYVTDLIICILDIFSIKNDINIVPFKFTFFIKNKNKILNINLYVK